jgi:hypothetical protein
MSLYPAPLIPWIEQRFLDKDGIPLAGGALWSYVAGSAFSTLQATYSDVNLAVPNPNPIVLDSGGRSPTDIRLLPTGYQFALYDVFGVLQYSIDNVEDEGSIFENQWGLLLSQGSKGVTSGYTVVLTDRLVTVSSSGGPNPCVITLPLSSTASQPVVIKNMGTVPLSVQRTGADLIETSLTSYTITAAGTPQFPAVRFVPDGVNNWWILGSHKL